jgi:hypothetical protein
LNGSAFNVDGSSAARVSAAGSNRAQLRNGLATFKSIRLQAREEGEYKLTIGSHSKKIAIQEASIVVKVGPCRASVLRTPVHVLTCNKHWPVQAAQQPAVLSQHAQHGHATVHIWSTLVRLSDLFSFFSARTICTVCWSQVVQHNFVCNLEVLPVSLPAADSNTAGCSSVLLVAVETENQQPTPWEAISTGMTLSLEVPDAAADTAAAAGAAGSSRGKGAHSSKASKRPDALLLTPECLWADQQIEGLGVAAAEAAAAAAPAGCVVCFRTPQLIAAGSYTVAAEFRETRDELLPGLKKEVRIRQGTTFCLQPATITYHVLCILPAKLACRNHAMLHAGTMPHGVAGLHQR